MASSRLHDVRSSSNRKDSRGACCGDELYSKVTRLFTSRFRRLNTCTESSHYVINDADTEEDIQRRVFCGEDLTKQFSEMFRQKSVLKKTRSEGKLSGVNDVRNYIQRTLNLNQKNPIEALTTSKIDTSCEKEIPLILRDRSTCSQNLRNRQETASSSHQHEGKKYMSSPKKSFQYDSSQYTPNELRPVTPQQKQLCVHNDHSPTSVLSDLHLGYVGHDYAEDSFNIYDDAAVESLVKNAMKDNTELTWYQPITAENKHTNEIKGVQVKLRYERGMRFSSKTFEPKLMWETPCKKCLGSIQLMDINRVIYLNEAGTSYRNQYPFANESRSFLIFGRAGEKHLFEAESGYIAESEVRKLKVVVSNLISKLASGDPANLFFNKSGLKVTTEDERKIPFIIKCSRSDVLVSGERNSSIKIVKSRIPNLLLANEVRCEEDQSD